MKYIVYPLNPRTFGVEADVELVPHRSIVKPPYFWRRTPVLLASNPRTFGVDLRVKKA